MTDEIRPRPAFAEALGDWFVREMSEARPGSLVTGSKPVRVEPEPIEVEPEPTSATDADSPDPEPQRRRRRWVWLANAALVIGALVAGIVLVSRPDETPPSDTASLPDPAVVAERVRAVCDEFAIGATILPFGADPAVVAATADRLVDRLESARGQLDIVGPDLRVDVAEQVQLLDESIVSAETLGNIAATGTRDEIDLAVVNVDLLVVAWGRSMDDLTTSGCGSPPTLREVL